MKKILLFSLGLTAIFTLFYCGPNIKDPTTFPSIALNPPDSLDSGFGPTTNLTYSVNGTCWSFIGAYPFSKTMVSSGITVAVAIDLVIKTVNPFRETLLQQNGVLLPFDSNQKAVKFTYEEGTNKNTLEVGTYDASGGGFADPILFLEWTYDTNYLYAGKAIYSIANDPDNTNPNFDTLKADFNFQGDTKTLAIVLDARSDSASFFDDSKIVIQKNPDDSFEGQAIFNGRDQSCWQGVTALKPQLVAYYYADTNGGAAKAEFNNWLVPIDSDTNNYYNGYISDFEGRQHFSSTGTSNWVDLNLKPLASFNKIVTEDATETTFNSSTAQIFLDLFYNGPGAEPTGTYKSKVDAGTYLTDATTSDLTFWDPFTVN